MTMVNGQVEYCAPGREAYCPVAAVGSGAEETATPDLLQPALLRWDCDSKGGQPVHINQTQSVQLFIRWGAKTSEQLEDYRAALLPAVIVDGTPVQVHLSHGPSTLKEGSDVSYIETVFDVGSLTPGTHVLITSLSFSTQVSDGYDSYGPGTNYPVLEGTCTVISDP
jgi:hypothetical protein